MFKILIKTFLIILTLQITLQARQININNLINNASNDNKYLIVWLHKTDCGYCESMKEFTLENETIELLMSKKFIYEHINVYEDDTIHYNNFMGTGREFAKKIGYDFYPTTLFFDSKANIILSEVGYIDNEKKPNEKRFFSILNFIVSKAYLKMDFEDYSFDILEEL